MSETRDPAIKLFGKTIPLPESLVPLEDGEKSDPAPIVRAAEEYKDITREITNAEARDTISDKPEDLDQSKLDVSSGLDDGNEDDHQAPTQDDKGTADPKTNPDQSEADASDQEVLKKPDKVLPCPRCSSLDTKFCYYNNYNVHQPRHFCKNCQRYWTAGGTMRNVPVGAGRRKNKHLASQYHHIMISSDGISPPGVDAPDSAHNQVLSCGLSAPARPLKSNGTVLKFGSEAPLCESMASVVNLGDQKRNAEIGPACCGENAEEPSCASSLTASNGVENEFPENAARMEQNGMQGCCSGLTPMHPLQCYPGPHWAYPWSPGWNNVAAMAVGGRCSSELVYGQENGSPNPAPSSPPAMMSAPAFCTIPFPFIPASFWGCMSSWPNGTWNVPWVGSSGGLSPSSSTSDSGCSGNGSPTLGKHYRDVSLQGEEKTEKSLWVPKTLRIVDLDEAGKSSIWATLGIMPDKDDLITKSRTFKAFQPKTGGKDHPSDATQVLHSNPAALSRFQTFKEST